jgi:hypothetical protein
MDLNIDFLLIMFFNNPGIKSVTYSSYANEMHTKLVQREIGQF